MGAQENFIEVGHFQVCKTKQVAPGDMFMSKKNPDDGRIITTLSDGLGSGIKANVLATLTATMATQFVASDIPIKRAAEIIMNTLPVCKERGISYATFTLVDVEPNSNVRIVEYDNPPYILVRDQEIIKTEKEQTKIERKDKKSAPKMDAILNYSSYIAKPGDRIIFFSDGVTQAGMGSPENPFGLGYEKAKNFVFEKIKKNSDISARELAHSLVNYALSFDNFAAKDDITCGVIYFREPRELLIISGPPIHKENDTEFAAIFESFPGKKIVCGGTTANIISRELNREIKMDLKNFTLDVPPEASMEGCDLVTEGIITLGKVAEILEKDAETLVFSSQNAACKMVNMILNSDRIKFIVGTKINEVHQDPNMPVELEIRRNIVKRIASILQEKYLKEVSISYF